MKSSLEIGSRIEQEGPLPLEPMVHVNSWETVANRLGHVMANGYVVESESGIGIELIESLLPYIDPYLQRYLRHGWAPQENQHSKLLLPYLQKMNIPVPDQVNKASPITRFAGKQLARARLGRETTELAVMSSKGVSEVEARMCWSRAASVANEIHEPELAERMFIPMARQEGSHHAFDIAYVEEWKDHQLHYGREEELLLQLEVVAAMFERKTPIGTQKRNYDRLASFGRVLVALTNNEPENVDYDALATIAQVVQDKAEQIVHPISLKEDLFVTRYFEAVEIFRGE